MRTCPNCNTPITNDAAIYCLKCSKKLPPVGIIDNGGIILELNEPVSPKIDSGEKPTSEEKPTYVFLTGLSPAISKVYLFIGIILIISNIILNLLLLLKDWFYLDIYVLLLSLLWFASSIKTIIHAAKTGGRFKKGDMELAYISSKQAFLWLVCSCVIILITCLIIISISGNWLFYTQY